ncbi:MAG: hypothetical protein L0Z73_10520 [Gammaproteobacteria bacterium]|nr:hypothetical protein [Gammaproteobacteria bacterium]
MMEILGWAFGIIVVLFFIWVAALFGPIVFVEQIGTIQLKFSRERVALLDGVQITEISDNEQPLPYEYQPGTGDVAPAESMLLAEDGTLVPERQQKEGETYKRAHVLSGINGAQTLVVVASDVYRFEHDRLGDHLGTFSGPALGGLRDVYAVTENALLIVGSLASDRFSQTHLYQVTLTDFHLQELAADPYYILGRPPKIFKPVGFNGAVLVYYTGSFDFAMGGDASRPKYSVIRIYTRDYPSGQDIVKLGLKAGTVVNVSWQDGAFILQADPSFPSMVKKPRMPARVWRVKI